MKDLKKRILAEITSLLEKDLAVLVNSAHTAREAATHEESKAEDKYDTRGLEASYLAGAQAKRAAEIQELIRFFQFLELRNFNKDSLIAVTALVQLECGDNKLWAFLVPKGGAMTVQVNDKRIQIVSAQSPLGAELIGRQCGAEFELQVAGQKREYSILQVI